MNKKGVIITGGFLMAVILIFLGGILVLYIGGGSLAAFSLSQIPTPIWILLGIILLFKLIGGVKRNDKTS